MYVQMCIKGVNHINLAEAQEVLAGEGLTCNWWRERGKEMKGISPPEIDERLNSANLDLHINSYEKGHPDYPGSVKEETPFISLTAGAVSRNLFLKTNFVHPAHLTALSFASNFGRHPGECYLFYCWVVVGLTPAVEVKHLAEEVRELNTYRRFSAFQTEGEIVAKIEVPARQIHRFERYEVHGSGNLHSDISFVDDISFIDAFKNPRYVDPYSIVNIREVF